MNIAIINTHDTRGGATRAVYRLIKGIRVLGENPVMLVQQKYSTDPQVCRVTVQPGTDKNRANILQGMLDKALHLDQPGISPSLFSLPVSGCDLSHLGVIRQADIINLHWIANFQSVETIGRLLNLGKPVVWTLHDESAYTGGCHYTAGCLHYRADCRDCPQLPDHLRQVPSWILENKSGYWQSNLRIVTPSRWLADCVRQSRVLGRFPVTVIANSLETDIFTPQDKIAAKTALGLKPDSLHILFNAEYLKLKRKGYTQLLSALEYCLGNSRFRKLVRDNKICLVTVGKCQGHHLTGISLPLVPFGYLESDTQLAQIYAAADLYVLPSLEDNLPNTMLEAMACATPVIGFAIGGLPDAIEHGHTGLLIPPYSSEQMGKAILNLVFDPALRSLLGCNGRQKAEQQYALTHQAKAYLQLFRELVPQAAHGESAAFQETLRQNPVITLPGQEIHLSGFLSRLYQDMFPSTVDPVSANSRFPVAQVGVGNLYMGVGRLVLFPIRLIYRLGKALAGIVKKKPKNPIHTR